MQALAVLVALAYAAFLVAVGVGLLLVRKK
jgi:hypothetical protein